MKCSVSKMIDFQPSCDRFWTELEVIMDRFVSSNKSVILNLKLKQYDKNYTKSIFYLYKAFFRLY